MLRVPTAVDERVTTVVMTRDRRAQLLASLGRATGRVIVVDNHPEPGPERSDRHAVIARNSLLTALMRRPWPVAVRCSVELGRAAHPLDWVRVLPACARALRRRRPSPPWVEDYLTRAATTSGRSSSQSARNLASP